MPKKDMKRDDRGRRDETAANMLCGSPVCSSAGGSGLSGCAPTLAGSFKAQEWETIGETISVGKPVGGVLPVAFWWRHSFYRIIEVINRRFYGGSKELTVRTEAGVFKLEEKNRAWVVAARSLIE